LRCQDLTSFLCRDLLQLIFKRAEIATEQKKELNKEYFCKKRLANEPYFV
jgi:hypothetical protein